MHCTRHVWHLLLSDGRNIKGAGQTCPLQCYCGEFIRGDGSNERFDLDDLKGLHTGRQIHGDLVADFLAQDLLGKR